MRKRDIEIPNAHKLKSIQASMHQEVTNLKVSARNQVKGKVTQVKKGVITAQLKIRIEAPATLTAVITKEAVQEMKIKKGDDVVAVIKATSTMVSK